MKRTRIKPVSDKRKILNVEYEKAKREWRACHDGQCEFRMQLAPFGSETALIPATKDNPFAIRCKKAAQRNPHHIARRGNMLCNQEYFLGVCFDHHNWIEENGKQSERLGYLIRHREKH